MKPGNRSKDFGFTLIEMVVALTLVSLLAVGIFESLRFSQRTLARVRRADAMLSELDSSQRVLRTLLESAYPYQRNREGASLPSNLDGRKDEITFSAPLSQGGGIVGLARYSIGVRRNANAASQDLVIRWWVDRNGLPSQSEKTVVEETLLSNIGSLEWSYLGPKAPDQAGVNSFQSDGATWLDEWRERDRLPLAVRVRIKYTSEDARSWPELVVAPRIADDANCEFDVVAQNCRRAF